MQSVKFAAEERVKRNPSLGIIEAVQAVIVDCLAKNEDPGHVPSVAFLDWNWYRLDCYKLARGESVGVLVKDILRTQREPKRLAA